MADAKQHDLTYEQLFTQAIDLLGDMQQRMSMFETQDYWKIKLKAEAMQKQGGESSNLSGVRNK